MSKNVIFCFSGTGNCLDIAKNIARGLGDTDIVMMRRAPAVRDVHEAERVGFVFPCHAGGLPGEVEKFARSLFVSARAYTFGVVSCAGYPGSRGHLAPERLHLADAAHDDVPDPDAREGAAALRGARREDRRGREERRRFGEGALRADPQQAGGLGVAQARPEEGRVLYRLRQLRMVGGRPDFGTDCIQCLSCLQFCPREAIHMGGATLKRKRWHNPNVTALELNEKVIHID